jgi:DNA polymerase-3 subunit delta
MTFVIGRRFLIVDGVERWKDKELAQLESVMADMPAQTTMAFFGREAGRYKTPAKLVAAIKRAGGSISTESVVKPWELERWLTSQAKVLGIRLEKQAVSLLVRRIGSHQQRLIRELEKLKTAYGSSSALGVEEVNLLAANSNQDKAWSLADALVQGKQALALRTFLRLRAQGEQLGGLLYWMAVRLSLAHTVLRRLQLGESTHQIKRSLRMPPKAADQFIKTVKNSDPKQLRAAMVSLKELEVNTRSADATLTSDTEVVLMLQPKS